MRVCRHVLSVDVSAWTQAGQGERTHLASHPVQRTHDACQHRGTRLQRGPAHGRDRERQRETGVVESERHRDTGVALNVHGMFIALRNIYCL